MRSVAVAIAFLAVVSSGGCMSTCDDAATAFAWSQPGLFDQVAAADAGLFAAEEVVVWPWPRVDLDQEFPGQHGLFAISTSTADWTLSVFASGSIVLEAERPDDPQALVEEIRPRLQQVIDSAGEVDEVARNAVWSLGEPSSQGWPAEVRPAPHVDGRWVGGFHRAAPYNVSWITAGPVDWDAAPLGYGFADGEAWDVMLRLDVMRHQSDGATIRIDAHDRAEARIHADGPAWHTDRERLADLLQGAGADAELGDAATTRTTDPDACV